MRLGVICLTQMFNTNHTKNRKKNFEKGLMALLSKNICTFVRLRLVLAISISELHYFAFFYF